MYTLWHSYFGGGHGRFWNQVLVDAGACEGSFVAVGGLYASRGKASRESCAGVLLGNLLDHQHFGHHLFATRGVFWNTIREIRMLTFDNVAPLFYSSRLPFVNTEAWTKTPVTCVTMETGYSNYFNIIKMYTYLMVQCYFELIGSIHFITTEPLDFNGWTGFWPHSDIRNLWQCMCLVFSIIIIERIIIIIILSNEQVSLWGQEGW